MRWGGDGGESRAINVSRNGTDAQAKQASEYWRRPGLTYSMRSQKGFSARVLPEGCLFTGQGPLIVSESEVSNLYILGWVNSCLIKALLEIQSNDGKFMSGLIKALPWIAPPKDDVNELEKATAELLKKLHALGDFDECDHFFRYPPLASTIAAAADAGSLIIERLERATQGVDRQWNEFINRLYGVSGEIVNDLKKQVSLEGEDDVDADLHDAQSTSSGWSLWEAAASSLSFTLGITFGRWDIRFATGERQSSELPDPFAPLPVCPPGMLQNAAGLPVGPGDVPSDYPLKNIPWDGILVDDPEHPMDIERRIRGVIEIIWTGQNGAPTAAAIEAEACELLEVRSLREYFRKPAGFFADHLKRYSKSRRKAPIYWPLSTPSGGYTIWLYYHRLNDGTLYKVVEQFVEPKQAEVQATFQTLAAKESRSRAEDRELENAQTLLGELAAFRDDLLRLAKIWKPNLNDGVVITAAPLWRHFRLPAWQKELRTTWESLERGEYDWAHLAYSLWPERVTEKCKTDRSLAIAHNLEHLCTIEPPKPKKKRAKAKVETEEQEGELL
jgi:hypothetical protein